MNSRQSQSQSHIKRNQIGYAIRPLPRSNKAQEPHDGGLVKLLLLSLSGLALGMFIMWVKR